MDAYYETYPAEIVHLHLDKSSYNCLDTIWFKAYTAIQENNQPSALSDILYVELISDKDILTKKLTLQINAGAVGGNIPLTEIEPGKYILKAYTNWMRNFDEAYFYHRQIDVGSLQLPILSSSQNTPISFKVRFFPEGGPLVNGLRSRVAIIAINSDSLGIPVEGTVTDNNIIAAQFKTGQAGLGQFAVTPQTGKSYKVNVSYINGKAPMVIDLPQAIDKGFSITVNNNQMYSITIKIACSEALLKDKKNELFSLVAQACGKTLFVKELQLTVPVLRIQIDKRKLPSGIIQFTLLSPTGEPINNRLVFNMKTDSLRPQLTLTKNSGLLGNQVRVDLRVSDFNDQPVVGSFSMAVTNQEDQQFDKHPQSSIYSNLMITSESTAFIEHPDYYVNDTAAANLANLDMLMITQKSERNNWNNPIIKEILYLPEKGITISGFVKTPTSHPVVGGKVRLFIAEAGIVADTITDAHGSFRFADLIINGSGNAVLSASTAKGNKNVFLYVKHPFNSETSIYNHSSHSGLINQILWDTTVVQGANIVQKNKSGMDNAIVRSEIKGAKKLNEVVITAKAIEKSDLKRNLNGADHSWTIRGEKLKGKGMLLQGLISKLPVAYTNGYFYRNKKKLHIVIDGRVDSTEALQRINPDEVEDVKLLQGGIYKTLYNIQGNEKEGAGVGWNFQDDIILVTTKQYAGTVKKVPYTYKKVRMNDQGEIVNSMPDNNLKASIHNYVVSDSPSGFITYTVNGFDQASEVYKPESRSIPKIQYSGNTVYWNANILTGTDGKAASMYFNAIPKGHYHIVLEGLDESGNMLHRTYSFINE